MDHLRHELRCIAELADQAVAAATQQFSHGPLAAEDPEHLIDLLSKHHPPGVIGGIQDLLAHRVQAGGAGEGGGGDPRDHQVPGGEVIEGKDLADHGRLVGFDLPLLRAQACHQVDLTFVGREFVAGGDGRHQFLEHQQQGQGQALEHQQDARGDQRDRHGEAVANRLRQDFSEEDHGHRESDVEEQQRPAPPDGLEDLVGLAAQQDGAGDVEEVVDHHEQHQGPSRPGLDPLQGLGSGHPLLLEGVDLNRIHRQHGGFRTGGQRRAHQDQHCHHQQHNDRIHRLVDAARSIGPYLRFAG